MNRSVTLALVVSLCCPVVAQAGTVTDAVVGKVAVGVAKEIGKGAVGAVKDALKTAGQIITAPISIVRDAAAIGKMVGAGVVKAAGEVKAKLDAIPTEKKVIGAALIGAAVVKTVMDLNTKVTVQYQVERRGKMVRLTEVVNMAHAQHLVKTKGAKILGPVVEKKPAAAPAPVAKPAPVAAPTPAPAKTGFLLKVPLKPAPVIAPKPAPAPAKPKVSPAEALKNLKAATEALKAKQAAAKK